MAIDVNWIYWTVFIAYLMYLLVAGIRAKKQTQNFSDFLVAGRNIGPLLMGLSLGVTYFSASLLIGSGGFAGRYGLGTLWIGSMNAILGVAVFTWIFGNRTRALSAKIGCLTVPEMLGKRYQSQALQLYTALITFIFEILYLVAVYMGLSTLFSVIMPNVPNAYNYALILCGIITIAYLVIGGSHGAIATDLFESMIMLIGVLILLFMGLQAVGGLPNLNTILEGLDPGFVEFPGAGGFGLVGMILVSSMGVWGSPQMVSRYFTAKNKKSIKGGLIVSLVWASVIAILAYLNACIALGYNALHPFAGLSPDKSNLVPLFMLAVFQSVPWLGALFIACVTAASLTTEEKIILVSTSAISRDFYQKLTNCSDEKAMKLTKYMTIVITVIAVVIAMLSLKEILVVTFFAFSSMASAILIPYFYGALLEERDQDRCDHHGRCVFFGQYLVVVRGLCSVSSLSASRFQSRASLSPGFRKYGCI